MSRVILWRMICIAILHSCIGCQGLRHSSPLGPFDSIDGRETESRPQGALPGGATFWLSSDQVVKMKRRAISGDVSAATKLANHFGFAENNTQEERKWLRKAASLGDKESTSALKNIYGEK